MARQKRAYIQTVAFRAVECLVSRSVSPALAPERDGPLNNITLRQVSSSGAFAISGLILISPQP